MRIGRSDPEPKVYLEV